MKLYKKRTLALILASMISVTGSFGAENYKNCLMGLDFAPANGGAVNMILKTRSAYNSTIVPVRKDLNTYIIMLPDTNSSSATPDLKKVSANIESVNIRTMPYSQNRSGYTKITVKTYNNVALHTKNEVYIAGEETKLLQTRQSQYEEELPLEEEFENRNLEENEREIQRNSVPQRVVENQERQIPVGTFPQQEAKPEVVVEPSFSQPVKPNISSEPLKHESTPAETFLLIMSLLLIIVSSIFFFIKAKNKLVDVTGENINLSLDDEEDAKNKKKKAATKIKSTIKKLDATYKHSPSSGVRSDYTAPVSSPAPEFKMEEREVIDLDVLFKEMKGDNPKSYENSDNSEMIEEEENNALDDFLNAYTFADDDFNEEESEQEVVQLEETVKYDEEYYDNVVNNEKFKFSKDDVEKLNQLLNLEISDSTLNNINSYLVSNPIKKNISREEVLEQLLMEYTISRHATFSKNDVAILRTLTNFEIDMDFVTNLKTELPKREKTSPKTNNKVGSHTENMVLNVRDLLPDLSEALKKQGNKRIESEVKTETVFYQKGYDVKTLAIADKLPNLSEELFSKKEFRHKPSEEIQYADNSYEYETLSINNDLPDLQDMLKNPEKYISKKVEEDIASEEDLLQNLMNVQFKPFYEDDNVLLDLDSVKFSKSEAEDLVNGSEFSVDPSSESEENKDIIDEVLPQETEKSEIISEVELNEETINESISETFVTPAIEPVVKPSPKVESENKVVKKVQQIEKKTDFSIAIFNNKSYKITSTAKFNENQGCHLAKNDNGYLVFGYINEKLVKLVEYDELKSEKIQARISETLGGGINRYLVRIGLKKFMIDVSDEKIEYVMDLC